MSGNEKLPEMQLTRIEISGPRPRSEGTALAVCLYLSLTQGYTSLKEAELIFPRLWRGFERTSRRHRGTLMTDGDE